MAGVAANAPLLDLEKELSCSICTDVLYQPLTLLDCLHTFCGACLKEWFSWQAQSATTTHPYTCPSCRASVRATQPNATVTTLLDMFLQANPSRGKSEQEKEDMRKIYKPGDNVLPKLRRRRHDEEDEEDRRMLEEVRQISLQEVGVSSGSDNLSPPAETRRRNRSREREERRRRTRDTSSSRNAQREAVGSRDTSPRPRHVVEHQSSLRSLLSVSDFDSQEMEEEIMRQIREDGLLDGIDLENIDASQEEEITERIAAAFLKATIPQHGSRKESDLQEDRAPGLRVPLRKQCSKQLSLSLSHKRKLKSSPSHNPIPTLGLQYRVRICLKLLMEAHEKDHGRAPLARTTCSSFSNGPEQPSANNPGRNDTSGRISPENGQNGWRRCPRNHRMIVVGFEDRDAGQRRIVTKDLVGGLALKDNSAATLSGPPDTGSPTTTQARPPPDPAAVGATSPVDAASHAWRWRDTDGTIKKARMRTGLIRSNSAASASSTPRDNSNNSGSNNNASTATSTSSSNGSNINNAASSAASAQAGLVMRKKFPPDGGVGLRAVALWSYWPQEGVQDELTFPKGAEIREAEDINGDWFWGCYAGGKGLFPGNYVRAL
ncbi:putative ring finger domain-containing protein [Botryosphaeria dothidea]|uniref:Ring finger domain-containing protein n=1 Tax=Botryosphaeria dothidea TaxID=55169 RepID=A0A8H4J990_9PEZI|nr:putative ring finger domain-containing protein [Botryosphaeria dothidea]